MQFYLTILLSFSGIASATCNHDNCARAVSGIQQGTTHLAIASSDCSSFFQTTVTAPASTISITVTSMVNATTTLQPAKRQTSGTIPSYASDCKGVAAYSSACSCLGVALAIITAPTSVTTTTVTVVTIDTYTVTIPSTTSTPSYTNTSTSSTSSVSPRISSSPNCTAYTPTDPQNCGSCGNICSSGICENGVCTSAECQGQTCGGFTNCNNNPTCFCFSSSHEGPNNGFCGQNAVCSGLTPCASDTDCVVTNSTGDICAIKTCCNAPSEARPGVCLKGVCGNPAMKLKMMAMARRFVSGTAAYRH